MLIVDLFTEAVDAVLRWKMPRNSEGYQPLWIDVAKLDAAWQRDRGFHITSGGAGASIGKRYASFGEWMAGDHPPIEMPEVTLFDGAIRFGNGRHRFAWLRDHGVKALPVCVDVDQAAEIADLCGTTARTSRLTQRRNLHEKVMFGDLIEQVSGTIRQTIQQFATKCLADWVMDATRTRRTALGYDRYYDTAEDWRNANWHKPVPDGFKPFDPDAFDAANRARDWTAEMAVADNLYDLLPEEGNSPVYAAMGAVSKALTAVVRSYVKSKFGDPVTLHHDADGITVPVEQIHVTVWWNAHIGNKDYQGLYRSRAQDANGVRTDLTIVVDRDSWRAALINLISAQVAADYSDYDVFLNSVINTFAHEYEHLEQDIKGQKSYSFSYLPRKDARDQRRTRGGRTDKDDPDRWLIHSARPAEIDAFASAAAAEMVEQQLRRRRERDLRYAYSDSPWTAQNISTEDWNEMIAGLLGRVRYGDVPDQEYHKYIADIDHAVTQGDPNAAYLKKIKRRFLSVLYRRLVTYLRPTSKAADGAPETTDIASPSAI